MVTFILLTHTGLSVARTLGLGDSILSDSLDKRNSWWSKKSVDSSSDFSAILPEPSIDESDLEGSPDAYTKLYGCYVASCVPEFIGCARRSRTRSSFDTCKYEHRACAMHCWELAHESTGI